MSVAEPDTGKMDSASQPPRQPSNHPSTSVVEVAAGLIFRNGRLLIAQRHLDSHLGGLWEFPGGKREPGESFAQALARELKEELDVRVEVKDLVEEVTHSYPTKTVRLQFYLCRLVEGEPAALGCSDLRWINREQLGAYPFPEADAHLLTWLKAEDRFWKTPGK